LLDTRANFSRPCSTIWDKWNGWTAHMSLSHLSHEDLKTPFSLFHLSH
jgi:hypothetical protein